MDEKAEMQIARGTAVCYVSGSGKTYDATVTAVPENPWHASCPEPTVSLEFRDERGKLVRRERVLPEGASHNRRQVWYRN